MVNLLNNATKYTDEEGNIWLSLEEEANHAVLRVRDSGVGIAPELLPHVFDLFTQASRSLDRSQGGLGIGLTLAKKIVEMHLGKVEAKSAGIRQGSEFTVRLPLLISKPPNESTPSKAAEQSAVASRILIIDDNVDSADSLAMMLRMSDHDVQTVYSGQSALAAAIEYEPSIVLLDIGLPEVDGYEIARQLRQRPEFKAVWLIAITGYGQDADLQRSRDAGFDHHLVKPVDPQKLEELLGRLTKKRRSLD